MISLQTHIPESFNNLRLDQALAKLFTDYSRACLQNWIRDGKVLVDNQILRAKDKITTGQYVSIETELAVNTAWQAQPLNLNILYEDASLLIIHKPAGLVVHPGSGNPNNTLLNALLHHAPELAHLPRAGIVHRLDKDTSGLLVVARTLKAYASLTAQIQAHTVKREYFAIVSGHLISGGTISTPMGRHPKQRTRMAVLVTGKTAITHYRIHERFSAHTALTVFLETGRTHQIRVHMTHIHHPIIGDPVYGRLKIPPKSSASLQEALHQLKRQALHALKLTLTHPEKQVTMSWEAPLPADIQHLLGVLRENDQAKTHKI